MNRFVTATFTSSGSWVAPAGVTQVLVLGMGGGSGGAGSQNSMGYGSANFAGCGVSMFPVLLTVVPNTSYTITIGAGGTAGTGDLTAGGSTPPTAGGDSSFGALQTFYGAKIPDYNNGTSAYTYKQGTLDGANAYLPIVTMGGNDAFPGKLGAIAAKGTDNTYVGGMAGMSGEGIGGTGGNASLLGTGSNGGNAAANSGAGGGSGGNGLTGSTSGGAGGSGQIIVMWVE